MPEESGMRYDPVVVPSKGTSRLVRPSTPPVFSLGAYQVMTPNEVHSTAALTHTTNGMRSNRDLEMESIQSGRARLQALTAKVRLPPLTPGGSEVGGRRGERGRGRGSRPFRASIVNQSASTKYREGSSKHHLRRGRDAEKPHGDARAPSASAVPAAYLTDPLKLPVIGIAPMTPYHNPLPSIGQSIQEEADLEKEDKEDTPPPPYESTVKKNSEVNPNDQAPELSNDSETINSERPESAKSAKLSDETKDSDSEDEDASDTNYSKIVKNMKDKDMTVRLQATIQARKMLSSDVSPNIQGFLEAGIIEPAVECIQMEDANLQYEALWALTNIASGSSDETLAVVEGNAVPVIVGLLKSPDNRVKEQAVWALGNISGENYECRNLVIKEGVLPPLLDMLKTEDKNPLTLHMLRTISWILSNLTRHKPLDQTDEDLKLIFEAANILLKKDDSSIHADTLWMLSYISDGSSSNIQMVVDSGFCPIVVPFIRSANKQAVPPAVRFSGNIATGDDSQTDAILEAGVLSAVKDTIGMRNDKIKKEMCWLLSNVAAGNNHQKQQIIDHNLLEDLVRAVKEESFEVRKEANWAISNLSESADMDQIKALINADGIPALLSVLEWTAAGNNLQVALEGLRNILTATEGHPEHQTVKAIIEENDGIGLLETHSRSQDESVSKVVEEILNKFFNDDDSVDEGVNMDSNDEEEEEEEEKEHKSQEEDVKVEEKEEKEEEEIPEDETVPEDGKVSRISDTKSNQASKYAV